MNSPFVSHIGAAVAALGFVLLTSAAMAAEEGARPPGVRDPRPAVPPAGGEASGRGPNSGVWDTTLTVSCKSEWNGSCTSDAAGSRVCAPAGDEICGYAASVTSVRNGNYTVRVVDKSCLTVLVSAKGSGNNGDPWGGHITVETHMYSINPANPPGKEQRDKFCVQYQGPVSRQ